MTYNWIVLPCNHRYVHISNQLLQKFLNRHRNSVTEKIWNTLSRLHLTSAWFSKTLAHLVIMIGNPFGESGQTAVSSSVLAHLVRVSSTTVAFFHFLFPPGLATKANAGESWVVYTQSTPTLVHPRKCSGIIGSIIFCLQITWSRFTSSSGNEECKKLERSLNVYVGQEEKVLSYCCVWLNPSVCFISFVNLLKLWGILFNLILWLTSIFY